MIVALPRKFQFTSGELRPTIGEIHSRSIAELEKAMNDEQNWIGLLTHFHYERALSEYIAAYPHRLEDGLLPHPNERVRERVLGDKSRSDVLLTDRDERPVIVECKQGNPRVEHLKQIRHYMTLLKRETKKQTRGILVHGGARKLSTEVALAARKNPKVDCCAELLADARGGMIPFMGRDRAQQQDLFSTAASFGQPSPPAKQSSAQKRRHVLPNDLPNAVRHLDNRELDLLITASLEEAKRRGRLVPSVQANTPDQSVQKRSSITDKSSHAVLLTRGQINAVHAAFKAGIKPSTIARQFGISQSDVRKVLTSPTG